MLKMRPALPSLLYGTLSVAAALGLAGMGQAQVMPPDNKASPDIYKEIAGNDQYRMVEGIWKPGQRDNFHSHPRLMFYWVTDCTARMYFPDGTTQEITVKAGEHGTQDAIASHSVENRGTAQCRVLMFEPREAD